MPDVELPPHWYTHLGDDPKALMLVHAGQCLIQLRLMALDTQLKGLLIELQAVERERGDGNALAGEYGAVMEQRRHLASKVGEFEFISNILEGYYQRQKLADEVLPLCQS